jgi:hypothetical protein
VPGIRVFSINAGEGATGFFAWLDGVLERI